MNSQKMHALICCVVGIYLMLISNHVNALDCYVCESINGSDPNCEDPMNGSVHVEAPCRQGRLGHAGLAYARYCVKLKGRRNSDGRMTYIRRCSTHKLVDIPTHCGQFRLSGELFTGCITICSQNWCNSANGHNFIYATIFITSFSLF